MSLSPISDNCCGGVAVFPAIGTVPSYLTRRNIDESIETMHQTLFAYLRARASWAIGGRRSTPLNSSQQCLDKKEGHISSKPKTVKATKDNAVSAGRRKAHHLIEGDRIAYGNLTMGLFTKLHKQSRHARLCMNWNRTLPL
jgi:hypothetical protein